MIFAQCFECQSEEIQRSLHTHASEGPCVSYYTLPMCLCCAQVYILDQVRALEKEMVRSVAAAGLDDIRPRILVRPLCRPLPL